MQWKDLTGLARECRCGPAQQEGGSLACQHMNAPSYVVCHQRAASANAQVPVTFIYGDRDWMDPAGARRAMEGVAGIRQPSGPADQVQSLNSCISASVLEFREPDVQQR